MSVCSWRLFVVLLGAALLGACGSSVQEPKVPAATTLEAAMSRGPFGAGVTTLELVDTTRPTEPNRDYEGAAVRTMLVEVWYPAGFAAGEPEERDAALDASGAPYPLIVFAHGLGGGRRQSVSYTQHLASHGYIVVAPDFPLSNLGAPGGARLAAVLNQPGDVSFLIDSFLAFGVQEGHLLENAIAEEEIGVTGHSLGALTTLLTIYGPARDPRVRAALPIASPGCLLGDGIAGDASVPMLALGGSRDLLTRPIGNRRAYDLANPPRYFVELAGADHTRFADVSLRDEELLSLEIFQNIRGEDRIDDEARVLEASGADSGPCPPPGGGSDDQLLSAERQRELLRTFATPFFDAYLRGSDGAKVFLQSELSDLLPEVRFEFDAD